VRLARPPRAAPVRSFLEPCTNYSRQRLTVFATATMRSRSISFCAFFGSATTTWSGEVGASVALVEDPLISTAALSWQATVAQIK